MAFNNKTAKKPFLQTDEAANQAIIHALRHGPLYLSQIAKICNKSNQVVQQRLYRLARVDRVAREPGGQTFPYHKSPRWGLPHHIATPEKKAVSEHTAKSRAAPDWRNTNLKYDLDAHRRLAMMAR